MAGTIKANAVQLGDSVTAANNFVLQTNTDGTAKLSRGNLGATTQDILTVDAAGKVALPNTVIAGSGPCFSAFQSVSQTVPASTDTKISLQAKEFDTLASFDNLTNYRFQPSVPGYYQIQGSIYFNTPATIYSVIHKNGSAIKRGIQVATNGYITSVTTLTYLNGSSDYVELYGYNSVGSTIPAGASFAGLQGFLARAA